MIPTIIIKPCDVAQYIIDIYNQRQENLTTAKMQKLVFYAQAWSHLWDDLPLFEEDFEAWICGPVLRSLYEDLKGFYYCPNRIGNGDPRKLSDNQKDTINKILDHYGKLTTTQLIELSKREEPYLEARTALAPYAPSTAKISKFSMANFYSGLID